MRTFLILLTLITCGCSHQEGWHYSSLKNSDPTYDMAKLSYDASSHETGLRLELIRQHHTIEGYINALFLEIPPSQVRKDQAEIIIKGNELKKVFMIDRLAGGQRLHLSEEALTTLLDFFHTFSEVTIQAGYFSQTFHSKNFERAFQKLCKIPSPLLPEKFVSFELY